MERKNSLLVFVLFAFFTLPCAFAEQSFTLNSQAKDYEPYEVKLPRGQSTVSMQVQLTMPVSELTVPVLRFQFPDSGPENLASIIISDELCTGEYNTAARFASRPKQTETLYFEDKIPWPETIPVKFKTNQKTSKGWQHQLDIYGETQLIYTKKKLKKFTINVIGEVSIESLKIKKEVQDEK